MSSDVDGAAAKDPAAGRPRPLLGAGFWAMLALGLVCVMAGIALAVFAPRLGARHPAPRLEPSPPQALGERPQSR